MPCFRPLSAYLAREANESGKRGIVFDPRKALGTDVVRQVPCGYCVGCRLDRAKAWAVRCVHESACWNDNCFITLTFSDDKLPQGGSLDVRYFQKFMKRLRKKFGGGVRFFHCGEYGEKLSRPHFHACLFNFDFPDKVLWKVSGDVRLYRSAVLEELWPFGFSTVGDVTFDSAAYVASYCVKKVLGTGSVGYYNGRKPEYVTMSRRPGIGFNWIKRWLCDVYPHDYVVMKGFKLKPARYYDKIFELTSPGEYDRVKLSRKIAALCDEDNSHSRLKAREVVLQARVDMRRRSYEGNCV